MAKTVTVRIGYGMPKSVYNLKGATILKLVDNEKTKFGDVIQYIKSHVNSMKASLKSCNLVNQVL